MCASVVAPLIDTDWEKQKCPYPHPHEQTGKLRHQEEGEDVLTGAEDCGFAPTHLFPFHSQGKAVFQTLEEQGLRREVRPELSSEQCVAEAKGWGNKSVPRSQRSIALQKPAFVSCIQLGGG